MGKRKSKSKRSLTSVPKGLPQKRSVGAVAVASGTNPFDRNHRSNKKPKFEVHNRFKDQSSSTTTGKKSKLALSLLQKRQDDIQQWQLERKKSNTFVDRRIGEYDANIDESERTLARLVRERSRRSKRQEKYSLGDDDHGTSTTTTATTTTTTLTHGGKSLDTLNVKHHVVLSSDEEDGGNLDAADTEMHFGGGRHGGRRTFNPYTASSTNNTATTTTSSLVDSYSQRKTELDEMITRRKVLKAERILAKESQIERFQSMDQEFDTTLSSLLQYRDKQAEIKAYEHAKQNNLPLSQEDQELMEWNRQMKSYMYQLDGNNNVKATDRTKTPQEIAQQAAQRLHELETRRLARMNGHFSNDDFSDISDHEKDQPKNNNNNNNNKRKKKNNKRTKSATNSSDDNAHLATRNPEALSDSEDDDENDGDDDDLEIRFTSDGLVYIDSNGNFVKKVSQNKSISDKVQTDGTSDSTSSSDDDDDDDNNNNNRSTTHDPSVILPLGTKVQGNYRVKEQYNEQESWYTGTIRQVHKNKNGTFTYDVDYDDGDFEERMEPQNVRPLVNTSNDRQEQDKMEQEAQTMKRKRQKAKEKARHEMPYVFEVPTTLEALHEMIATHASTGEDASLLIQRIHSSNSVRLDKRHNTEKMQNFYDVLLRRFIAVGDAVYMSGNGGPELGRYQQLDQLTKVLYLMSQDAPSSATAVWSRRLGVLQKAHAKRLRDAEWMVDDENEDEEDHSQKSERSAWPSTGTILLLRSMGHFFPVTDLRHTIVTPTLLFLGQCVAQTPVQTIYDMRMGILCTSLLLEYTREAKRVVPEAMAFLSGTLSLFGTTILEGEGLHHRSPIPSLEAAKELSVFQSLRSNLSNASLKEETLLPKLSLELRDEMSAQTTSVAVLVCTLDLIERTATFLAGGTLQHGEAELFAEVSNALLALKPQQDKQNPFPKRIANKIAKTANVVSTLLVASTTKKTPLTRRSGQRVAERAIKSLAPRVEDYSRYSMSKDKGKSAKQAALDRTRRESKREHKAVARELRMDAAMVERQRMKDQSKRDAKAKAKRHANYSWLEGEQATMNQQVRQGGGLLSGGGMGAARAKARSGKLGMKKGGKLSR